MRYWLIAIWQTIPRSWVIVSLPVIAPLALLLLWWVFGSLWYTPPDPQLLEYRARLESLLPRAQSGDRAAQYEAGIIYRDGLGGTVDAGEAVRLFELAARQGSPEAQYALGALYAKGIGARQNFTRAAELYRTAAGLGGNVQAQYALGDLYFYGRGVTHDYLTAIDWFRRAALNGHAGAQSVMGSMYEKGFGIDRDPVQAYVWYSFAAEQAQRALSYRGDIDPRIALAELKSGMSRLELRNAEHLLTETRRALRPKG